VVACISNGKAGCLRHSVYKPVLRGRESYSDSFSLAVRCHSFASQNTSAAKKGNGKKAIT